MRSKDWWLEVVATTYKTTHTLNQLSSEELDAVLPEAFELLYSNIFSTSEGWTVKEDVEYTLDKLVKWRDLGSGPKLGTIIRQLCQ